MPIAVSSVDGRAHPEALESGSGATWFTYVKSQYIAPPADGSGPQAFLVEMEPRAVIPPHFHRVAQFQVVMGGGGALGKHPIGTVSAHFADPYTPYGPLAVGPEGVTFFTLRTALDAGANYMPAARAKMIRKAGRNLAGHSPLEGVAGLGRRTTSVAEPLLAPHADGVGAVLFRLGPRGTACGPEPGGSGGQYALVASGTVRIGGATLPRWSCVWIGPDEPAVALEAGGDGAEVITVQFPRSAGTR